MFSATRPLVLAVALFACVSSSFAESSWPQWRGPGGQGHSDATSLPTTWSETENITWKTPLEGKGWSSPVIDDGQIWLTTAVEELVSEEEKKKRLATNTGSQPLDVAGNLTFKAICLDQETGKQLANVTLMTKTDPQPTHTLNSFASPTPVLHEGRLYCHFGSYGTCCLDTESKEVLWKRQDLVVNHENGPGSTPILWNDHLIFHMDGSDEQYVIALNRKNGETLWRTNRSGEMSSNPQLKKSYGTPLIVQMNGTEVLVSPGSDWLYGYAPETGRELWKVNYGVLGFSIVPRPVVGHGKIFMTTSFMKAELLAIDFEGREVPEIAWRYKRQVAQQPSPLLVENEVYTVSDRGGIITCLDAGTGEVNYVQRLGGNYSASPTYADGKIYISNRDGETSVIKPGPKWLRLAKNKLDGQLMASPAIVDNAMFMRTDKALYRIEKQD